MRLVSTVTDENGEEFEIADKYARENMQEKVNMPTNLSEFRNDMGFIDKTVDDLENYYLKEDTYNREEISELLTKRMAFVVVESLPSAPAQDEMQCVFLVKRADKGNSKNSDTYDEYIWAGDDWELIGDTSMDLSDYYTKKEVNDANNAQDAALAAAKKELDDEDAAIRREMSDADEVTKQSLLDIEAAYRQADTELRTLLSADIDTVGSTANTALQEAMAAANTATNADNTALNASAMAQDASAKADELAGENLAERMESVESKISDTASKSNQLIDRKTAETLIGTGSGTFIGTFESFDDLRAYDGEVKNNDYAFVYGAIPEHGEEVDEYFPDGLETPDAPERYVLTYRHNADFEVGESHTFTIPLGKVEGLLRDCTDWYVDLNAESDAAAALEIRAYYGAAGSETEVVVGRAELGGDERQFHIHWSPNVGAAENWGLGRDYLRIEISSDAAASVNHLRLYAKRERYTYAGGTEEADGSTPEGYLLFWKYTPYRAADGWNFQSHPTAPGTLVRVRLGELESSIQVRLATTDGAWESDAAVAVDEDNPEAVFVIPSENRYLFMTDADGFSPIVKEVKLYGSKTIDYGSEGTAIIGAAEEFDASPNGYSLALAAGSMTLGLEARSLEVAENAAQAMKNRLLIAEASFEEEDAVATAKIELLGADGESVGGGTFQSQSGGAARMYVRYTGAEISEIRVSADGEVALKALNFYSPGQDAGEVPARAAAFALRRAAVRAVAETAQAEEAQSEAVVYSRYKYSDGHWLFEYTLNNSGFTQHQYEAIGSGITAEKVAKIAELEAENAALRKRVEELEARPVTDTSLTARVTALEAQLGGITFSIV